MFPPDVVPSLECGPIHTSTGHLSTRYQEQEDPGDHCALQPVTDLLGVSPREGHNLQLLQLIKLLLCTQIPALVTSASLGLRDRPIFPGTGRASQSPPAAPAIHLSSWSKSLYMWQMVMML